MEIYSNISQQYKCTKSVNLNIKNRQHFRLQSTMYGVIKLKLQGTFFVRMLYPRTSSLGENLSELITTGAYYIITRRT